MSCIRHTAQAFSVVQQQIAGITAARCSRRPFLARLGLYKALLPDGDVQLRHPTPQSVTSLSLDAVKRY